MHLNMYIYYIFSILNWYTFNTIPTNVAIFINIGLEVYSLLEVGNVTLLEISKFLKIEIIQFSVYIHPKCVYENQLYQYIL